MIHTCRRLLAALAVTAVVVLGGQAAANASLTVQVVNTGGIGIASRSAPQLSAVNGYGAPEGATVTTVCWTWGDAVGPYSNRLWWLISYAGRQFYAADRYLSTPTTANQPIYSEPQCGAAPPPPPPPPPPLPHPSGTYVSRTMPIRFCVDTAVAGCQPSGGPQIAANSAVAMVCWQDGSWVTTDYATNRWFWVRSSGGTVGFVTAGIVRNQTGVPACSANRGITAASVAASRSGQAWASPADQALFPAAEWQPGPQGEWSGDCVKLGYVAWHAAGVNVYRYDAIRNWNLYLSQGKAVRGGAPQVGSLVFFNLTSLGHEAVYVGDGYIATTNGIDNQRPPLANTVSPLTSKANYLGTVMPG